MLCMCGRLQAEPLLLPRQWSGDAAGTTGNIKLMAECIAGIPLANRQVFTVGNPVVVVGTYFDGVGLAGTANLAGFIEYIQDGITANDIRNRCVEVYRFIVEYCTKDSEVWLLGFSRGAFTVRSVAGMINNFGIVDKTNFQLEPVPTDSRTDPDPVCAEVYRMYRSRDKQFRPDATYPGEFRDMYSLKLGTRPTIKFMGLLDTVGSLGVPTINAGYGLEFLFYDQVVSEQVENVYQALAAHDVFFGFDPCFVRRKPGTMSGFTLEVWFPGAHWDLGRQRFVPFRTTGGLLERVAHRISARLNLLGVNVEPTLECSVEPLNWMLRCMRQTDPSLFPETSYDEALGRCLEDLHPIRLPFLPQALKQNALEELNNRFFHSLSPLSASLALRDRQIPEYSDANFIGKRGEEGANANNEAAFSNPESGFNSKAYNMFKALRSGVGGIRWVPYGQSKPPTAARPLEALTCSCKCSCSVGSAPL